MRESCEKRHRATERETLVTLLGCCRNGDVVNRIERNNCIARKQTLERLSGEIVGARVAENPLLPRTSEGASNSVDEIHRTCHC